MTKEIQIVLPPSIEIDYNSYQEITTNHIYYNCIIEPKILTITTIVNRKDDTNGI